MEQSPFKHGWGAPGSMVTRYLCLPVRDDDFPAPEIDVFVPQLKPFEDPQPRLVQECTQYVNYHR